MKVKQTKQAKPVRGSKSVNKRSVSDIKNEKKPKKRVMFFNVLIVMVVLMCAAGALSNFAAVAQRQERLDALEREHNSVRIQNEVLRNQIEKSREVYQFDEEHVVSVARAHGLRKDSDIIFHISSGGE